MTRIKGNARYGTLETKPIGEEIQSGVLEYQIIEVTFKDSPEKSQLGLREIRFYNCVRKREFKFLTNLLEMRPDWVVASYKLRWKIELLFKQLKQNFPLKYSLGDNENAIKIKIYCTLIANLLMTVVQKSGKKALAFSNLVSYCKIHLFNYLIGFLEKPGRDWLKEERLQLQYCLF